LALHAIIEYIKYSWKARGRHGTHSPFVYDFVEAVLQDRGNMVIADPVVYSGLSEGNSTLLNRIRQHYDYRSVRWLPDDHVADADIVVMPTQEPLLWASLAKHNFQLLKRDSLVFVANIHDTAVHTHEWNSMRKMPAVKMSIDLYGAGLLLFKEQFKEQQHFILKDTG
jgi:hypothetical protein